MPSSDLVLIGSYDPSLVVLSVFISLLAAYASSWNLFGTRAAHRSLSFRCCYNTIGSHGKNAARHHRESSTWPADAFLSPRWAAARYRPPQA